MKLFKIFIFSLILGLGIYLGIIIYFLTVNQSKYIYFPDRNIKTNPSKYNIEYEQIYFLSSDNTILSGWFIPADNKDTATILFCHGNSGNISDRIETIKTFHDMGYNLFIFDYRGYGESEGKPSEKGTYEDARAAWRYLVYERKIDQYNIIICGRSLGGAIAAWLAQRYTPRALILEATFTSIPELAKSIYPYLPVRLITKFKYSTIDYIKNVHSPVLIVHSKDDTMILFSHAEELYKNANDPKEFLKIQGDHSDNFIVSQESYRKGIKEFIEKNLKKQGFVDTILFTPKSTK